MNMKNNINQTQNNQNDLKNKETKESDLLTPMQIKNCDLRANSNPESSNL